LLALLLISGSAFPAFAGADLPDPDPSVRPIPYGVFHRSREYCRPKNRRLKLCQKVEISLPVFGRDAPVFTREIAGRLSLYLKDYEKSDPVRDVEEVIGDYEGVVGGEWYDTLEVDLYARTPSTYTLRLTRSEYSGGAHGSFTVMFLNFLPGREAPVKISECFRSGSGKRLLKIAEHHYRREHGLTPNTPLTADGWFEKRFVTAENFAFTSRGILFLYNQYEIKPYAAGLTTFLLPYEALHGIIDPDGPLAFALK
jgi:hypothetical protein